MPLIRDCFSLHHQNCSPAYHINNVGCTTNPRLKRRAKLATQPKHGNLQHARLRAMPQSCTRHTCLGSKVDKATTCIMTTSCLDVLQITIYNHCGTAPCCTIGMVPCTCYPRASPNRKQAQGCRTALPLTTRQDANSHLRGRAHVVVWSGYCSTSHSQIQTIMLHVGPSHQRFALI